jgi:hypothetical protein
MGKNLIGFDVIQRVDLLAQGDICGGSALKRYSHGLDLSIIEVDDHPLITVTIIWDRLAQYWEYVEYPLSNKAFKIYLKMSLKNKK